MHPVLIDNCNMGVHVSNIVIINVVKCNLTQLTTKRCWFSHVSGSMMERFA